MPGIRAFAREDNFSLASTVFAFCLFAPVWIPGKRPGAPHAPAPYASPARNFEWLSMMSPAIQPSAFGFYLADFEIF